MAWMFAAGAGWPVSRRVRLSEVIVRHMWDSVDPAFDAEGHLLEVGTALDISGRDPGLSAPELRAEVLAVHPRLDLVAESTACFADQGMGASPTAGCGGGAQRDREPIAANVPPIGENLHWGIPSASPARYPAPVRTTIRSVNAAAATLALVIALGLSVAGCAPAKVFITPVITPSPPPTPTPTIDPFADEAQAAKAAFAPAREARSVVPPRAGAEGRPAGWPGC